MSGRGGTWNRAGRRSGGYRPVPFAGGFTVWETCADCGCEVERHKSIAYVNNQGEHRVCRPCHDKRQGAEPPK